ncbi:SDR family oxidoreductase [Verminephrobacter eiseniae]|nr:SDR family oxidoreductase [Verminephrobacter eiseniae]MCW5283992.1 SDR family oxidoreductase [Verminephrobacter eiseniae]MCW5301700.1 SDR family oxidoreductase [Verminephrobacter eiseniae]MCW8179950.1 SDR family oxidoreductase [Verminephrobacter eiseniae]MCW8190398.1 SDR family oxidoreductase [Verminephrobacter eiseniae]
MSGARPPEGAHTAAGGEGAPSFAARPPEGAHTVAEGEGTPVRAAPGVALVTGASAGIGKQICADLLAQGYEVLALARRKAGIDHPRLHSIEVDLSDASATAQAVRECVERFAPTTIVHNAGAIRAAPLSDVKLDDLDALIDLHLGCAITLVQGALPAMRAQRFGRVVLMSSRAVLGLATRTSYSATKAGMLGLARTWALELAADGITVNVVAPGPIRTDMFYDLVQAGSDKERALAASVPVKRLGEVADVARAVRFFTEPGSGFVTGQVLYVCGGTSIASLVL